MHVFAGAANNGHDWHITDLRFYLNLITEPTTSKRCLATAGVCGLCCTDKLVHLSNVRFPRENCCLATGRQHFEENATGRIKQKCWNTEGKVWRDVHAPH